MAFAFMKSVEGVWGYVLISARRATSKTDHRLDVGSDR